MQSNTSQQNKQTKNFQFLSTLHFKQLNCKICQKLMLQPIRLDRCGHTLCHSCVENKSVKSCPICLSKINAKQKDILASRLVGQLGVRCTNQGCPWKGAFQQYTNFHSRSCRLNEGGIEGWLKSLQNTISQNIQKNGGQGQQINKKQGVEDGKDKLENLNILNKQREQNIEIVQSQTLQKDKRKQNTMIQNLNSMKNLQLDSQRISRRQTRQKSNFRDSDQNLQKKIKKFTQ